MISMLACACHIIALPRYYNFFVGAYEEVLQVRVSSVPMHHQSRSKAHPTRPILQIPDPTSAPVQSHLEQGRLLIAMGRAVSRLWRPVCSLRGGFALLALRIRRTRANY